MIHILWLMIGIPLFYQSSGWILNLRTRGANHSPSEAIAFGLFLTGIAATVSYYCGISAIWMQILLPLAGLIILLRKKLLKHFLNDHITILAYYLPLLAAAALVPMPGMFGWWGDWMSTQFLTDLLNGNPIPWEAGALLSSRPPLNGFAAAPFYDLIPPVANVQGVAVLASATMVMAAVELYRTATTQALSRIWQLALLLGAPALLHSINIWAKPLSALGVLLFLIQILRYKKSRAHTDLILSAVWFALSVATHESSILYGILLVPLFGLPKRQTLALWSRVLATFAMAGIVIVGIHRIPAMLQFGMNSAIASNPALFYRDPSLSGLQVFLDNIVSTFTGYGFGFIPLAFKSAFQAISTPDPDWMHTLSLFSKHVIPRFAGCLIFVIIPLFFFPAKSVHAIKGFFRSSVRNTSISWIASGSIITILHAILTPYSSHNGIVQAGLLPLQMLIVLFCVFISQTNVVFSRSCALYNLLLGIIPVGIISFLMRLTWYDSIDAQVTIEQASATYPDFAFFLSQDYHTIMEIMGYPGWIALCILSAALWISRQTHPTCVRTNPPAKSRIK